MIFYGFYVSGPQKYAVGNRIKKILLFLVGNVRIPEKFLLQFQNFFSGNELETFFYTSLLRFLAKMLSVLLQDAQFFRKMRFQAKNVRKRFSIFLCFFYPKISLHLFLLENANSAKIFMRIPENFFRKLVGNVFLSIFVKVSYKNVVRFALGHLVFPENAILGRMISHIFP